MVACLAIMAALSLFVWLRSSDVFAVQQVTADTPTHVSKEQIEEATTPAMGESLLVLSVGSIEDELSELPYVRSARVLRRFPNTLHVRLTEYEPVARVQAGDGEVWLVSNDGTVLEKKKVSRLPLFVPASPLDLEAGQKLPATVSAALPLSELMLESGEIGDLPRLHHVSIARTGEVVMVMADEMELRLGEPTELKQKLTVVSTIVQQYLRAGKRIRYVDASVPDRVAVNAE